MCDDMEETSREYFCVSFFERRQKAFAVFLLDEQKKKKYIIITTPIKLPTTGANHSNKQR